MSDGIELVSPSSTTTSGVDIDYYQSEESKRILEEIRASLPKEKKPARKRANPYDFSKSMSSLSSTETKKKKIVKEYRPPKLHGKAATIAVADEILNYYVKQRRDEEGAKRNAIDAQIKAITLPYADNMSTAKVYMEIDDKFSTSALNTVKKKKNEMSMLMVSTTKSTAMKNKFSKSSSSITASTDR